MASSDTAALIVALSAQVTQFQKDMDNAVGIADKSARQIETRFNKINPNAALFDFINQLQTIAAGGAIGEAVKIIADLNAQVAQIGDHAAAVGLTTDQFQQFRFAVIATGGSIQAADTFLNQFANHISQAAKGQGDLYNFLKVNNVALRDSNGQLLPASTLLAKYSDLVKNTKSPLDQMNEAVMVAGRNAGPELVNALKLGSDGLNQFAVDADAAGTVLDASLIERAKKANEQFQILKLQATTVFEELAVSFTASAQKQVKDSDKAGQDIVNSVKTWWTQAIKFIEDNNPDFQRMVQNARDALANTPITGIDPNAPRRGADITAPLTGGGKDSRFAPAPAETSGDGTTQQFNLQADAFKKLILLQEQRITLLHAEGQALGLPIGQQTALTEAVRLETEAKQKNIPITAQRRAEIEQESQKVGQATQALEALKVASDIDFGRKISLLTPEDVQIAQQLKGLYGNDIPAALASSQAAALRLNATIADAASFTRDLTKSFGTDIRTAIENGASGWEVFRQAAINALNKIADKLISISVDQLWSAAFGGSGGLNLFNLFGGAGTASTSGAGSGLAGAGAGLAGGSLNWRGGTVLVGEHGPEYVDLPGGSSVTPVNDLPRFPSVASIAPSGSGGINFSPIYNIDARGSQMNPAQFRDILAQNNKTLLSVIPDKIAAFNRDPRARP
jgi:hypothetical protein